MSPNSTTLRFEVGPYWIQLPAHAEIAANVIKPPAGAHPHQAAWTDWIISFERFQFFIHLDSRLKLSDLKRLFDQTMKCNVRVNTIGVNGVPGVTHGGYGPPRTWIDWWLKKGDVMICLYLQSRKFAFTEPTPEEMAEHSAIIHSIQYAPDVADGARPLPRLATST
jgi:hypothetical protein